MALAVGAAPILLTRNALDQQAAQLKLRSAANNPGAAVLTGASSGPADPTAPTLPLPQDVPYDWVQSDRRCAGALKPADPQLAAACSETADGEPSKVIAVVGNSRVQQLSAALKPLAAGQGYKLVFLLRGGCTFGAGGPGAGCDAWNALVLDWLLQVKPRAVFTTSTFVGADGREALPAGLDQAVSQLTASGIDVIGVRDQPRMPFNPIACVSTRSEDQCTVPARQVFAATDGSQTLGKAVTGPGRLRSVDLTPWICPDGQCRPVIGNVFVYLDPAHLSQVYASTLAPMLDDRLAAAGWRW